MAHWSSSSSRSSLRARHWRQASVDRRDLEEEDVWSSLKEIGGGGDYSRGSTAPRMIPSANPGASKARRSHPSSAPMNIPDWSKIHRSGIKADGFSPGFGSWVNYQRDEESRAQNDEEEEDKEEEEEEEEEEDKIFPPHEWIARKLAKSQISSSSMCEGMGRTLKGRDLSRVRNAILTKTGFLE